MSAYPRQILDLYALKIAYKGLTQFAPGLFDGSVLAHIPKHYCFQNSGKLEQDKYEKFRAANKLGRTNDNTGYSDGACLTKGGTNQGELLMDDLSGRGRWAKLKYLLFERVIEMKLTAGRASFDQQGVSTTHHKHGRKITAIIGYGREFGRDENGKTKQVSTRA
jgi:hypothetical protein